jgi:hypothetical protein
LIAVSEARAKGGEKGLSQRHKERVKYLEKRGERERAGKKRKRRETRDLIQQITRLPSKWRFFLQIKQPRFQTADVCRT